MCKILKVQLLPPLLQTTNQLIKVRQAEKIFYNKSRENQINHFQKIIILTKKENRANFLKKLSKTLFS